MFREKHGLASRPQARQCAAQRLHERQLKPEEVKFMTKDRVFCTPPVVQNAAGKVRNAGFELEYTGVSIFDSAQIVLQVFGGRHIAESTFVQRVETDLGRFTCEIDTTFLKDRLYEKPLAALGI